MPWRFFTCFSSTRPWVISVSKEAIYSSPIDGFLLFLILIGEGFFNESQVLLHRSLGLFAFALGSFEVRFRFLLFIAYFLFALILAYRYPFFQFKKSIIRPFVLIPLVLLRCPG